MLHTISFLAVVAAILLTACVVVVLESGGQPTEEDYGADLEAPRARVHRVGHLLGGSEEVTRHDRCSVTLSGHDY